VGGALAAAAIFAVAGASNASAAATHVGLVVDGQGTYCVTWTSGMSGVGVLTAAGLDVVADPRQGGLIVTIGSVNEPDSTKQYWAYFENTGGGWAYSNVGAGSTRPQPGTVEGWRVDQTGGADTPPTATSYASICGAKDAPAPPAPVTAAPPPAPPVTTKAPVTSRPVAPATSVAPTAGTPATRISAGGIDPLTITSPDSATSAGRSTASGSAGTGSSVARPSAEVSLVAGTARHHSTSPVGFIVAGSIAVVLVGAGGFTAWRRRPSAP
jgi:hypothetical protein